MRGLDIISKRQHLPIFVHRAARHLGNCFTNLRSSCLRGTGNLPIVANNGSLLTAMDVNWMLAAANAMRRINALRVAQPYSAGIKLRAVLLVGLMLTGVLPMATALGAPPLASDLVKPALYAESTTVAPDRTLWLDLHLAIAPGWHIYWHNPDDSGLPTEIDWNLPAGFSAGAIVWPAPARFSLGPIANYGYAGGTDLLVPIAAPVTLDPGAAVHFEAAVNYLACSEICIPGTAKLPLDLATGPGEP